MVRSCFCGNEQNVSLKLTSRLVVSYVELCVCVRVCVYEREREEGGKVLDDGRKILLKRPLI